VGHVSELTVDCVKVFGGGGYRGNWSWAPEKREGGNWIVGGREGRTGARMGKQGK